MFRNSSGVTDLPILYKKARVRALIVEDDKELARALKEGLEADHYCVSVAPGLIDLHAHIFEGAGLNGITIAGLRRYIIKLAGRIRCE
jgi:hypothetical protein